MVRGNKAVSSILDSVEYIMDDDSHYADSLVRLIDPQSIKGKKLRARYALLYTATQYKEYQHFTSDSLIMEAVHYYSFRNNIDYRFLSYYYLGCVYLELHKNTEASVALAQAELLVDKINNDHWKGLLYIRSGILFNLSCDFMRAQDYYLKSAECFERAGRELNRLYAIWNLGRSTMIMTDFSRADSILQIAEKGSIAIGDSILHSKCLLSRISCLSFMHEPDLATELLDKNGKIHVEESEEIVYNLIMSQYYIEVEDYTKAASFLDLAGQYVLNEPDRIYLYYFQCKLADNQGDIEKAFYYHRQYASYQNDYLRKLLNQPVLDAQYSNFKEMAELENLKARNKITTLVTSIILFLLIAFMVLIVLLNKKRQTEERIRDYISSINDLTTQISVNKDKISKLNDKVREMLRQQFNPSDYLYTRYYEQIDDNKKAERLYRVVRNQVEDFTNRKNIEHIDELLNETFDGIMSKVLSSGIDIKEKDLLLLRFVLAGFSSKSIAALLGETHLNVNQRKKRLLDKIQIKDAKLMSELSNALNNK